MSQTSTQVTKRLEKLSLKDALTQAMRLAREAGDIELGRWCRLELQGYWNSNSAMNDKTNVPDYRVVAGQHFDLYGNLFVPPEGLGFLGTTWIRNGVEEIEGLISSRDMVTIHDPDVCEFIRQELNVEVYSF